MSYSGLTCDICGEPMAEKTGNLINRLEPEPLDGQIERRVTVQILVAVSEHRVWEHEGTKMSDYIRGNGDKMDVCIPCSMKYAKKSLEGQ